MALDRVSETLDGRRVLHHARPEASLDGSAVRGDLAGLDARQQTRGLLALHWIVMVRGVALQSGADVDTTPII